MNFFADDHLEILLARYGIGPMKSAGNLLYVDRFQPATESNVAADRAQARPAALLGWWVAT